jgi:predicted secreted Zn-dependent protease
MKHRSFFALIAGALALTFFASAESRAGVTVREKTIYYKVSGRTGKEIYAQIGHRGPLLSGSRDRKVATTTLNFEVRNPKFDTQGRSCILADIDLVVNVTYRIPQWTGASRASAAVHREWKQFLDHIWRHEKQHMEIARDHANDLRRQLRSFRGDLRRDCEGMFAGAEKIIRAARLRHDRRQQAFDASWFGDGGRQFKYDRRLVAAK